VENWIDKIKLVLDLQELEKIRIAIFGKKGELAKAFANMKNVDPKEKPKIAKELNQLKQRLTKAFEEKKAELEELALQKRLESEAIDVSLYSPRSESGALHPVMQTMDKIIFQLRQVHWLRMSFIILRH